VPLALEQSILVGAAPEKIWRLISEPASWRFWWPQCKAAETADRRPLHDGSRVEIQLHGGLLPWTARAEAEVVQRERALLLRYVTLGTTLRLGFYLDARPNGTAVRERLAGEGSLLLYRLLRRDLAAAKSIHDNLRGLKRAAERGL
jgi:hypothetical protein